MILKLTLLSLIVTSLGCAHAAGPLVGVVYTDATGPITATGLAKGSKKGKACAASILGIIATGDASIVNAAKNGSITKIATVDQQGSNILGFYAQSCTLVTGE